ncbi:cytosine permease [Treponema primitia]|uniref:cytosine permease n=1 Tax=Treponema primitia TaxID=88058 RepID=UPI000255575B|nr:cytosine permease [Treponema primitia]
MENKVTAFKIDESQRQSWVSLAAVWIGAMVCVPCLMVGGYLSMGFPISSIVICVIIGYGIICAYMCFMGMQGCDTGLPTVSMASNALGEGGARFLISLLLAVACIGWFGVQAAVCGSSFSSMIASATGVVIPNVVSGIFWGVVMLLTAMFGYNALKYLNYIAIPALILVLGYSFYAAVIRGNGLQLILDYKPAQPMTIVAGINLVVATFAVGGVISGDFSRYARNRKDVIKSNVIGVFPAGLVMLLLGAACSIVAGEYDISKILVALGLPAFGLIALILATWTTNVTNAYSGGLAVSKILGLDEKKFKITTGIAGGIGTILGAVGIIDRFVSFLGIITSFIPPVAGVVIAAYWIVGKGKKENFTSIPGVNWAGMIAFILGAAIAFITANVAPFFVAPINGIVISIAAYIILIKFIPAKTAK